MLSLQNPSRRSIAVIKLIVFCSSLLPIAFLVWRLFHNDLGANPIEALIRGTGDWALRFLLITLGITPLRKLSGLNWLVRLRRMLGLYAFFYALLHFMSYVGFDQGFDLQAILKDVWKRPFITFGFTSFLLLIPLAITSITAIIRYMGGKRWQTLHSAIYPIGIFASLHYWWLVKIDTREPLVYACILAALLGIRIVWR